MSHTSKLVFIMPEKGISTSICLMDLLKEIEALLPYKEVLEGANNFQKRPHIFAAINGLDKYLKSIESYVYHCILKPWNDCQDMFVTCILTFQNVDDNGLKLLSVIIALAYKKGDMVCLEEIADRYQHYAGVGYLMINLGVMFSERMEYKKSETCFVRAKNCFEREHDHLGNAVACLNLAILHKVIGNDENARSHLDSAASLCHDISMRMTRDVYLPWKVLRKVADLFQEFGNYKRFRDVLHIGVVFDISGANEVSINLMKRLMALQLKEMNGENIQNEELEDVTSQLPKLLNQLCTDTKVKQELPSADLVTTAIILAKMYRDINQLEEGCMLLKNLEAKYLQVHGRAHFLYALLLYQVGRFKLGAGKAGEAENMLKHALEMFVFYFSKGHHMVASCKSLLGTCALLTGHSRDASIFLNEALHLFQKINPRHPEVAEILLKFAFLQREEGNLQSAKITMQEALDIFISVCGENSPKTASAYIQAAAILQKTRESRPSAVDKLKKAIDIFLKLGLRRDHPDVINCQSFLGVLQHNMGSDEAKEQFTEVQQQVSLQEEPYVALKIISPEITHMFFEVKTSSDAERYPCFGATVVSLVNLVYMKVGKERRAHLNVLLTFLQGHEIEMPFIVAFAGQNYIFHKVSLYDRCVYCVLTDQGVTSDSPPLESDNLKDPNVFLLSSSTGHGKKPCSLLFWRTPKVMEMEEPRCMHSAFRESVTMLFLQPKFRKGYKDGQDFYMELMWPIEPHAMTSLYAQIDYLPLLVEQLSVPHKDGNIDTALYTSLVSDFKPSTHISHFSYRFLNQRQAEFVFDNLICRLAQSLALTKVEGVVISNASAVEIGEFFFILESRNFSLSIVVKEESVRVKCHTVKESESTCICSSVKNTLDSTMDSLCCVVSVAFKQSVQLCCDDHVGCNYIKEPSKKPSCSGQSSETLYLNGDVRSQEPECDELEGKPPTDLLQSEVEGNILFSGQTSDMISTEVCLGLLECLLTSRHVLSEVQLSGSGEMSSSTYSAYLDDEKQLSNSMLSPGSISSLNSFPISPSNEVCEMPAFVQDMLPSLNKTDVEPCDEKTDSNNDDMIESTSGACAVCSELPLKLQEELSNHSVGENSVGETSAMRSSHEGGVSSGENKQDTETNETVQLEDGTQLSKEEIFILKSEVAFCQNQCHELRQQLSQLKELFQQCEEEKQQLELELGRRSFLEDKQKRNEKAFLPSWAHANERSKSCSASGASYAFTDMEGNLCGGAGPLQEPCISLQQRLLEISNSLSDVELRQIKFLAKPRLDAFRLAKIREGFELFEELDASGVLSCTYVRELLEGIQRFDLLERLDVPLLCNTERGSLPPAGQTTSDRTTESSVTPPRESSLEQLPENPTQNSSGDNLQMQSSYEEGLATAQGDPLTETRETDTLEDQLRAQSCHPTDGELRYDVNSLHQNNIRKSDSKRKIKFLSAKNDADVERLITAAAERDSQEQIERLKRELQGYEAENRILQAELERTSLPTDQHISSGNISQLYREHAAGVSFRVEKDLPGGARSHPSTGQEMLNRITESSESSSTTVSSSELSLSSATGTTSVESTSSSCTSHSVCDISSRVTLGQLTAVKNHERFSATSDASANPTSSEEEILESTTSNEYESGDMCENEYHAAKRVEIGEVSESSGDISDGPGTTQHLKMKSAASVAKDVIDCGPLRSPDRARVKARSPPMPGLMQDVLPDGDISEEQNVLGAGMDTTDSGASSRSNQWARLGARPRDRPPIKMAPPPEPSLIDLVPQRVAEPMASGLANAFLARHSQDQSLHASLCQGSAVKLLSDETPLQGASYMDGTKHSSELNKAKPYFGDCQVERRPDVDSRWMFPPLVPGGEYDSYNAVGGYAYNTQLNVAQFNGPVGPLSSYVTGGTNNFSSSNAFNSSNYNSFKRNLALVAREPDLTLHTCRQRDCELNTSVPGNQRLHSGITGAHIANVSLMGAAGLQLTPPVHALQRYSGPSDNASTVASEREQTQPAWKANSRLTSIGNMARVDVGSSGLPAPLIAPRSNGVDNRRVLEAGSSRTSQLGTGGSDLLNTSGDRVVAGASRDVDSTHTETALLSAESRGSQLVGSANGDSNLEPRGAEASLVPVNTGGSMLNRDFGTDSVESTDNSLLALEQRVEEACALVERVLREREEREQFGREIERKEREIRERRARKKREREAREQEEASRWPQQQEAITGRSQWLCEHYQRHCRVRFPCCSHFYSCHRCHNNSKACDNEEAKASHATHLKCSFCQHEQEIGEDSGKCCSCGAQMSAYYCSICKHFTSVDKNPYHCEKCGICRIHKDKSFHCDVCNVCLDKRLEGKHKCRPDSGHDECCICLEDAFSGCQILPCSHKVHRECAIAMIQNGIRTCPVCRHPLYDQASE